MTIILWSNSNKFMNRWLYIIIRTLFNYKNTMKDQSLSQKFLKITQKFKRFNMNESIFLIYLVLLCILFLILLFVPIIRIDQWSVMKFRLFSWSFVWTMVIVLISLAILIGWNFSAKFKNLFLTYFGWRENDSLINFLFLFILTTVFLSIKNTANIAYNNATQTMKFSGLWNFVLIWLLLGIIFTLISVVKWAQKTWKKTKIINVVDDEHRQWEAIKEEIKKWLFEDQTVRKD